MEDIDGYPTDEQRTDRDTGTVEARMDFVDAAGVKDRCRVYRTPL